MAAGRPFGRRSHRQTSDESGVAEEQAGDALEVLAIAGEQCGAAADADTRDQVVTHADRRSLALELSPTRCRRPARSIVEGKDRQRGQERPDRVELVASSTATQELE